MRVAKLTQVITITALMPVKEGEPDPTPEQLKELEDELREDHAKTVRENGGHLEAFACTVEMVNV